MEMLDVLFGDYDKEDDIGDGYEVSRDHDPRLNG